MKNTTVIFFIFIGSLLLPLKAVCQEQNIPSTFFINSALQHPSCITQFIIDGVKIKDTLCPEVIPTIGIGRSPYTLYGNHYTREDIMELPDRSSLLNPKL